MTFAPAKVLSILLLAASLAGCVDANLDVALTSETTAKATLTQVMRSDSMTTLGLLDTLDGANWQTAVKAVGDATAARAKAEAAGKDASDIVIPPMPPLPQPLASRFCRTGGLLMRADGGASCIEASEGPFAEIALGELEQQLVFTPVEAGLVRIALPTAQLRRIVTPDFALEPEVEAALPALFSGRKIVVKFSGMEVTETNMTLAKDGLSARQDIAIVDLISGKAARPDELYAVVRAP